MTLKESIQSPEDLHVFHNSVVTQTSHMRHTYVTQASHTRHVDASIRTDKKSHPYLHEIAYS